MDTSIPLSSLGFARLSTLLAPLLLLAACGGGGDNAACGGPGNLSLDVTYEVNGQLVDPRTTVVLARGTPVVARPQAIGLPSACAGAARWTFAARTAVPTGLAFDASTGVITGTPTSLASFRVDLRLKVDGYTADVSRTIDFFM
jgi:Putative Ig domain